MNAIYKEARRCYKNAEFPSLSIRTEEDGAATVWSKDGKFLQCFASRLAAERALTAETAKASKFIQ
jgi:hypothetical protein